jgi:hypothetical protein
MEHSYEDIFLQLIDDLYDKGDVSWRQSYNGKVLRLNQIDFEPWGDSRRIVIRDKCLMSLSEIRSLIKKIARRFRGEPVKIKSRRGIFVEVKGELAHSVLFWKSGEYPDVIWIEWLM